MQKSALITGITGQDGTYLAEFLIEKGYKIDTEITKMLQQSSEKINNLICFISKIN